MRLINVKTYEIVEHMNDDAVKYAILSHTWGAEEVTLQEMKSRHESITAKKGFKKIEYACQQARIEGLDWAWVDTCCIDKTSSAELSEAINSMFRWYRRSQVCYVYLVDLPDSPHGAPRNTHILAQCRWFTRGWCLQELLAPMFLVFYSNGWERVGSLSALVESVSTITRIDAQYLTKASALYDASIAVRMSWAAGRYCSRVEDTAYSLLGIFDVNIPLLYGEGPKAFIRLQEEIWKETDDHTLLAWHVKDKDPRAWKATGVFAESPDDFRFSSYVISTGLEIGVPSGMTKRGLSLFASTHELAYPFRSDGSVYKIPLNCADMAHDEEDGGRKIMLFASQVSASKQTFARIATPGHFYWDGFGNFKSRKAGGNGEGYLSRTIYIQKRLAMHGQSPGAMDVDLPKNDVLFFLEGPMQPTWYENQWFIDQRLRSTFPRAPWCPMGDFSWFHGNFAEYSEISEPYFFILQLGGSASPYMDEKAAVIETAALSEHLDPPRYAQFLLVNVQTEETAGGFRVGMKMAVEIRCAIRLLPKTTKASIALFPWDEDVRVADVGRNVYPPDWEHQKKMEKWTVDSLSRSHSEVDVEGRLLLAQDTLDLEMGMNKGRRLHVQVLMEKKPDGGWGYWHTYKWATPHIHLRFTMIEGGTSYSQ